MDINISTAHMIDASGSGDSMLNDIIPRAEDLIEELTIPSDKIVAIKIPNVDLSFAETDSTQANGDASIARNNSQGKELQMWDGGSGDEGGLDLEDDPLKSGSNGWHAEDMFNVNEQKFGVKLTNFKESEEKYTMKVDYSEHDAEKIKWANQVANDIEGSDNYKRRVNLELDDGTTEEDKYSAVKRENSREQVKSSPTDIRANKEAMEKRDLRSQQMRENREQRSNEYRRNHELRNNDKDIVSPQGNRQFDGNSRVNRNMGGPGAWGSSKHQNRYNTNNPRSNMQNSMPNNRSTMQNAESPTNQGGMKHNKTAEKPPRFARNQNSHDDRHQNLAQNDNMLHQAKPQRTDRHMPQRRTSGGSTQPRHNAWGSGGHMAGQQGSGGNSPAANQSPQEYHSPQGGVHNGKMVQANYKSPISGQQNPPLPSQVGSMPPQQPMQHKGKQDHRYQTSGRNPQVSPIAAVSTKPLSSATVAQSVFPPNHDPQIKWSHIASKQPQQQRNMHMPPMAMMQGNAAPIRPHIINVKQEAFIYQVDDKDNYPTPQAANMPQQYPQQMGMRMPMHAQTAPMQAPMQQTSPMQQAPVPHTSPMQVPMPQHNIPVQGQSPMVPQGAVLPPQQPVPGTQAPPMPQRQVPPQGRPPMPQQQPTFQGHPSTKSPVLNHQVQQTQVTSQISGQKQQQPAKQNQPTQKMAESKPLTKTESSGSKKGDETSTKGSSSQLQELKDFHKNFKLSSGDKDSKKETTTPSEQPSSGVGGNKNPPTNKDRSNDSLGSPMSQKTENVANVQRIPVNDAHRVPTKEDAPPSVQIPQQPKAENTVPAPVAAEPSSATDKVASSVEPQPSSAAGEAHKELNPDAKEFKPTFRTTPSEPATPTPGQTPQLPQQQVYQVQPSYVQSQNYQSNQKRFVAGLSQSGMVLDQTQTILHHPGQIQTNQYYQQGMYLVQPQNSPSHQIQHQIQPQIPQMQGYTTQFDQNNTYMNRQASGHPSMMTQPRMTQQTPHTVPHYHSEQAPPPQVYVPTSQTMPGQYPNPQMPMGRPNSANSAVHGTAGSPAQPQQPQNSVTPTQQSIPAPAMYYPPSNNGQFVMPPGFVVQPQHPGAQYVQRQYQHQP